MLALMLLGALPKLVTSFPDGGADQMTRLQRTGATGHERGYNSFWHRATRGEQSGYTATNRINTSTLVRRMLLTMRVRVTLKPYASAHQVIHHLQGSTTESDATCQCVALHHLLSVHRSHSRLFTGARRGRCLRS
jgi:hypothetical protein